MGRTLLSSQRLSGTKRTYIGHIIIFCEGESEKNYFDYFAAILNKNKYTDVEVVVETVGGNARTVFKFAQNFMCNEEHSRKFNTYGKYLAFDCDDPPDIQEVIVAAADYELLVSNHLFEIWLLMHFENVETKISKKEIYKRLSDHLHGSYSKAHKGKTREIIQNGNIEKAIDNARLLDEKYIAAGKSIFYDIKNMNPYTSVFRLIEQFMAEISTMNG